MFDYNSIAIGEPLWTFKGKQGSPSVGIHPDKIEANKILAVEILFKKENGEKLYDGRFLMNGETALRFPKHSFRFGELIVIPLDEFDYEPPKKENQNGRN